MKSSEIGFIVLSIICLLVVAIGVRKALIKCSGLRSTTVWFVGVVAIWSLITGLLASLGLLSDFSSFPPKMLPIILLPPLVTILILTFSKLINNLLLATPVTWLIYFQVFRVAVEILIWGLYEQGLAPIQMTFEGMNYDILVGLTAPIAAYLYQKGKMSVLGLRIWNVAGLLILLNILVIAVLSMPTPIRYFMNEPANTIVSTFPVIWLPTLLVPMAYGFHLLSLKQLSLLSNTYNS